MVGEATHRQKVTVWAESGDLRQCDTRYKGFVAELLALMNIGEVHFYGRKRDGGDRIANSHTRMRIPGRINNDSVETPLCLLYPCHQLAFKIRLANRHADLMLFGKLRKGRVYFCKGGGPVDRFLSGPQEVQIGTMEHEQPQHFSVSRIFSSRSVTEC